MPDIPSCWCCRSPCADFGSNSVLGRISVKYYKCPRCGSVRTEEPYWLDEAYSSPIAALDIGLLGRCLRLAEVTELFCSLLNRHGTFLDWAGGYGTLTRLLR